jgi:hypothetical protein
MNIWDPDRASCDGPEETDSEDERKQGFSSRSQLIAMNSKGIRYVTMIVSLAS